jgi:NAD(P)-dependent dehydrogenase (short-subunit alcohol dehydrogenase family)
MITGATSGIGEVTAHEIAAMGAEVILVARNESKAQRVAREIEAETPGASVRYMLADLAVMDSVRNLAETFKAEYDRLDVLINNAGMMFTDKRITTDGYEQTFALDHLNYFLLTNLLLPEIKAAGTPERKARIINVSSNAHRMGQMNFDNLNAEKGYNAMNAYGMAKLANVMFTYALHRRLQADGADVVTNALHPGFVNTGFGKNNDGIAGLLSKALLMLTRPMQLSADQGAETQIYLATSPKVEDVSGKYFVKKKPVSSSKASYDEAAQERLWTLSEEMTGLTQAVAAD